MADNIRKCNECGFENHGNSRFCVQCGSDLIHEKSADTGDPEPNESPEVPQNETVEVMRRIAEESGYEHEKIDAGWRIKMPMGEDRKQIVYVTFNGHDDDGNDLISFFSVCGEVLQTHAMDLLRFNSSLAYGAYAIKTFQGKEYYVMRATQLAATADTDELRNMLTYVGAYADDTERQLYKGGDVF